MIRAGIIGASGYSGNELIRILMKHPEVEMLFAQSKSNTGKKVSALYPATKSDIVYSDPSLEEINEADVVFLALPREEAAALAPRLKPVVIDLSPAHRFDPSFVYGLPEVNFEQIRKANRIANPGCYATACILGILPLADEKIEAVAFDCKSGYSGGGKAGKYNYEENVIPYALSGHYQEPEIGKFVRFPFSFAPHVVDAFRGLVATIHVFGGDRMVERMGDLETRYARFYSNKPFVRILKTVPDFNSTKDTPYCTIGGITRMEGHAIIVSSIDNLLKGASSQAVQNMNIRFGFKEEAGLG